jgi:hypothetical protein
VYVCVNVCVCLIVSTITRKMSSVLIRKFVGLATSNSPTNRFNFDSVLKWMRAIYIALIHFKIESKLNRFVFVSKLINITMNVFSN